MSRLPLISGRKRAKALRKVGFVVDRERESHSMMWRGEPKPARTVVVPNHKEIAKGTLKDIIEKAGLTETEFRNLL